MAKEEVTGEVPDRRAVGIAMPADGQHELVLRGGDPFGLGLPLAPLEEPPQLRPERQVVSVVGFVREPLRCDAGFGIHGGSIV